MTRNPGYLPVAAMSESELIAAIERLSPNTTVGLSFLTDELHRRRMNIASDRMEVMTKTLVDLTKRITTLTYVGVGTSAAALIVSAVALLRS
jgi:hypothetical protein